MQKYDYAFKVRNKLIKLLSLNPACKTILEYCKYNCQYHLDHNAELLTIEFMYWDSIYCNKDGAYIVPEHGGESTKVLAYGSFDELLEI